MAKTPHPEVKGIIFIFLSLFLTLSLISFNQSFPSQSWLGLIGYWSSFSLTYLFGLPAFLFIGFSFWCGWKLLITQKIPNLRSKSIYFSIFIFSCSILLNLLAESRVELPECLMKKIHSESIFFEDPYPHRLTRHNFGGVPTYFLYKDIPTFHLQKLLSNIGIFLTFGVALFISFLQLTEIEFLPLLKKMIEKIGSFKWNITPQKKQTALPLKLIEETLTRPLYSPLIKEPVLPVIKKEKAIKQPLIEPAAIHQKEIPIVSPEGYMLPPASLLTSPKKVDQPFLKKELKKQADILEETLMSFGIEAKVGEINCGPTITSFEVHPAIGVKVQKITALENDVALNLEAKSIRIIAPIPGKAAIGVEIPSLYPQEVSFKEMLTTYQQQKKMHIPILLGKSVNGDHVLSDLTKMPHCIIAGATGSGKSVCINTIVLSIVMNASPNEIKLVLIDPKKVELTGYTQLPHLLAPVITEPHGAYAALNWLVKEMTLRYEILRQLGLRNIQAFNSRTVNKEFEASLNLQIPEKMFFIVAIIDEFADLMMVSSSDLETPIARIAQMARAVGIHLILATQRPSREVITGLIKANFPTRIAFKVASRVNSQIILDENGADSLLGNGDMLFLPPGSSQLIRAQGAYISDEDINKVISFISQQAPPNYLISSFDEMKKEDSLLNDLDEPKDSLYDQALLIVLESQNASTTFLQRKLKIGYARAASLIDELEAKGVISGQEGSKPRKVLKSNKKALLSREEDSFDL